jgi:hypothetical protein
MIVAGFVLQLSLWIALTSGFFIWDPCRADNRCSQPGVKTRSIQDAPSEGLTLEVFERSSSVRFLCAVWLGAMPRIDYVF